MNLDENQIRQYLNDNISFSKEWFVQNATTEFIREWFNLRREPSKDSILVNKKPQVEKDGEQGPEAIFNAIDDSLKNDTSTPYSTFYARLTKNIDWNSITTELFNDILDKGFYKKKSVQPVSRKKYDGLSEQELLMELIQDITNELDVDILCHKILVNVSILTKCDRASLFLAKGNRGNRYLVAKLFDVTPSSLLEDSLIPSKNNYTKIPPIPFGVGIVGHVALSKQNVNIQNAYQDSRFNKDIDVRTGYQTKTLLCQPILNFTGDVIGVAECINKLPEDEIFTGRDEEVFRRYLTFCGFSIQNAQLFEMSLLEYKRYQLLLNLARAIFEDTTNLETMITKIMVKTRSLLNSDKSRVYIIKNQEMETDPKIKSEITFQLIFELENDNVQVKSIRINKENQERDVPTVYACQAAMTKKILNSDSIDSRQMNQKNDASILSVPIFNNENKVLGVAQLIKSDSDKVFTEVETSVIEAFSIFCGLGLQSCMLYEEAIKMNAHQQVALEVLAYHASATDEETTKFMKKPVPTVNVNSLDSFEFDDITLDDDETASACLRIFIDMNFIDRFHIKYPTLCRWILSIRKNYRKVIYHNWRHALNVAQTMFVMIEKCNLKNILQPNEQLALIVASICHDLDHRGLNNSFQLKTCHPLTKIYSTSYMENHHFNHTMLILKSNGNNIFADTPSPDREEIIKMIEECILSTDLAAYMQKKDKFAKLVRSEQMDLNDPKKRELLRGMLMTACDLSAICKPWSIQKRVAELVSDEFYLQGDLETSLNLDPMPMMDRKQKDNLPKGQVSFIDNICLPLYELLYEFWPDLEPLYVGCIANRQKWKSLIGKNNI